MSALGFSAAQCVFDRRTVGDTGNCLTADDGFDDEITDLGMFYDQCLNTCYRGASVCSTYGTNLKKDDEQQETLLCSGATSLTSRGQRCKNFIEANRKDLQFELESCFLQWCTGSGDGDGATEDGALSTYVTDCSCVAAKQQGLTYVPPSKTGEQADGQQYANLSSWVDTQGISAAPYNVLPQCVWGPCRQFQSLSVLPDVATWDNCFSNPIVICTVSDVQINMQQVTEAQNISAITQTCGASTVIQGTVGGGSSSFFSGATGKVVIAMIVGVVVIGAIVLAVSATRKRATITTQFVTQPAIPSAAPGSASIRRPRAPIR